MRLLLLFNTVRYLKLIQIRYRIKRNFSFRKGLNLNVTNVKIADDLHLTNTIPCPVSFRGNNVFSFLNLDKHFLEKIDWEYSDYGRLWTYNLNYFEYLNQEGITPEIGEALITKYITFLSDADVALEPYPISLRTINWIQFFIKNKINKVEYNSSLFAQYELLSSRIEYHLLGNHLLENGFAFLWGAYFFNNEWFYCLAKKILIEQLNEQIIEDGAHFELSPMYHCLMLLRLLDCYNLIGNNSFHKKELLPFFRRKCMQMLGWMNAVSFKCGEIPLFNDAVRKITPSVRQLNTYAQQLGLFVPIIKLGESGYRKLDTLNKEMVIDFGQIGPNYQPGHAHADTFNFELYVNNRPVIVDTGTSTYEINEFRFYERSTMAHNTVVVEGLNSSQVWAGHRVGKRAKAIIIEDIQNKLVASHNGYQAKGVKHIRSIEIKGGNYVISDDIRGEAVAYLHFHPSEKIEIKDNEIIGTDYSICFIGAETIIVFNSYYAPEFNKRIPSIGVKINFRNKLYTILK